MLQEVLILSLIGAVYGQACPKISAYQHNNELMPLLTGTFYTAYTSSNIIIPCEMITWTGTGNDLTAIIQSPGCCRKVYNADLSNPNQLTFTVSPLNNGDGAGCLTTTETVIFKFIETRGTGDNLCIVFSSCRYSRVGIHVACRTKTVSVGLLGEIIAILKNLLSSIIFGVPNLHPVSQADCIIPANNCLAQI